MSETFFGCGRGKVAKRIDRALTKLARKHGADFVAVDLPGDGPRYWFAAPNRGEPFDRALAKEVLDAAEGGWPLADRGADRRRGAAVTVQWRWAGYIKGGAHVRSNQ